MPLPLVQQQEVDEVDEHSLLVWAALGQVQLGAPCQPGLLGRHRYRALLGHLQHAPLLLEYEQALAVLLQEAVQGPRDVVVVLEGRARHVVDQLLRLGAVGAKEGNTE